MEDLNKEFEEYLNTIFEAARAYARTNYPIDSKELENIFFSIGWVRNHLIYNGLLEGA